MGGHHLLRSTSDFKIHMLVSSPLGWALLLTNLVFCHLSVSLSTSSPVLSTLSAIIAHRPALPRQEEGSRRRALADHGLGGGGPDLRHLLPHLCPRHRHALAGHLVGPGLPSNSPLKCLPLLCVFFA